MQKMLIFLLFVIISTPHLESTKTKYGMKLDAYRKLHKEFLKATKKADAATCDKLLNDGFRINSLDGNGHSALHYAIKNKHPKPGFIAHLLLQNADPNQRIDSLFHAIAEKNTPTPLELIAQSKEISDEDSVVLSELLIQKGACILKAKDDNSEEGIKNFNEKVAVIGLADAKKAQKEKLIKFLEHRAIAFIQIHKLSALGIPYAKYKEILKKRIEKNKSINTPIELHQKTILEFPLHHLRKISFTDHASFLERCIIEQYNGLAKKIIRRNPHLINEQGFEYRPDVDDINAYLLDYNNNRPTPLMMCVVHNNYPLAAYLLRKEANPNKVYYSKKNNVVEIISALGIAQDMHKDEFTELLMSHGAWPNLVSSVSQRPQSIKKMNERTRLLIQ